MPRNRGRKAREKREVITRELSSDERSALLDAILEPPLAISHAVIGALLVEHELELSIKARLRKISEKEWEGILEDKDGPLGNFDRKIKFASYLGILDAHMRRNLDIIRSVRNRFAHTKRLISFEHDFIADELRKIVIPKGDKKNLSRAAKFPPQARYSSLCLSCVKLISKNRYGARAAAHKAWMRRYERRRGKLVSGGMLGLINPNFPPMPQVSTLPHHPQKTLSDPNNPTLHGLFAGLLPYLEAQPSLLLREADKKKK